MEQEQLDIYAHLNYGCDFCELDVQDQIKAWSD